ncbi:DUF512 domain-containing protein [Parablautia muri]|uniref:DUF512 domain-containing protein n=1 Tax=Parablautia muri TaxID=2320879 RepID=A0A9X5BIF9_9FIRM|nr:DUF512 domain-containing protein [Parablautia muri]NBJ94274.1 DUF512 domain-containing protein [Parablautia muri]
MNKQWAKGHRIMEVLDGSIASELEIVPGDRLLAIDGEEIRDIFDYQFYVENDFITLLIEKANGEQWELEIEKDEDEDLGMVFEKGLMDDYRSCSNKCIFCFIDQMPKGMRETLYFKDDDSRLSFLQGNYVTLTNMSDYDIERVIRYRLSPINISFQTMNPQLRCQMLHNRFAGEALKKVDKLYEAGITMNGQIVLCKGVNDGEELKFSIRKLSEYIPVLESVSVVPAGLTKYREGLYPLETFTAKDAGEVLETIHLFQEGFYEKYGLHFVHASDEWYILANRALPGKENYDGYLQLENGVGMLRLLLDEFEEALKDVKEKLCLKEKMESAAPASADGVAVRDVSVATGKLAYPYIAEMSDKMMALVPGVRIYVYEIVNYFFGEEITVAGLLTGQDMIAQLQGKKLGERLLLPQNMLRSGEEVFLDDVTVMDMEKALQVKIDIVKSSGYDFVNAVLGIV